MNKLKSSVPNFYPDPVHTAESLWTQKLFNDLSKARETLLFRTELALEDYLVEPVPSGFCEYCPYASCSEHPQHEEYRLIPDFLKEEEEE